MTLSIPYVPWCSDTSSLTIWQYVETLHHLHIIFIFSSADGGDGDSGDDLGSFDAQKSITYSWDSDGVGNKGQQVGYVGYAYLESPGNPFDGIDNDG